MTETQKKVLEHLKERFPNENWKEEDIKNASEWCSPYCTQKCGKKFLTKTDGAKVKLCSEKCQKDWHRYVSRMQKREEREADETSYDNEPNICFICGGVIPEPYIIHQKCLKETTINVEECRVYVERNNNEKAK